MECTCLYAGNALIPPNQDHLSQRLLSVYSVCLMPKGLTMTIGPCCIPPPARQAYHVEMTTRLYGWCNAQRRWLTQERPWFLSDCEICWELLRMEWVGMDWGEMEVGSLAASYSEESVVTVVVWDGWSLPSSKGAEKHRYGVQFTAYRINRQALLSF